MKRFWEWMKDKKYGGEYKTEYYIYDNNWRMMPFYSEQMLIGYMYEYISEIIHEIMEKNKFEYILDIEFKYGVKLINELSMAWNLKNQYEGLVEIINKLEEIEK